MSTSHRTNRRSVARRNSATRGSVRTSVCDPTMQVRVREALELAGRPMTQDELETAVEPGFVHGFLAPHLGEFRHCTVRLADGRFTLR